MRFVINTGSSSPLYPLAGTAEVAADEPSGWANDIYTALSSMETELAEIMVLSYFHGLNYSEISSRLGKPLELVKQSLAAGMRQLGRLLDPATA